MARTPAQRGKVGNWLVESRLARGWDTQAKARAEIARLTGWTIPQSVYAEWESGRRLPSDANLERLQAFYGGGPNGVESVTDAALIAVLGRIADALEVQARVLDKLPGAWSGYADGVQAVLNRLVRRDEDTEDAPVPQRVARR